MSNIGVINYKCNNKRLSLAITRFSTNYNLQVIPIGIAETIARQTLFWIYKVFIILIGDYIL